MTSPDSNRWLQVYTKTFTIFLKIVGGIFCVLGSLGGLISMASLPDGLWGLLVGLILFGIGVLIIRVLVPRIPALVGYQTDGRGKSHVSDLRSRSKQ